MDYFVLTVASLILFAATFFSTVTGFGFALIAAPVLTMVMGPKETVVFVIIAGVIVRVIMMWRTWGEFEWPTVLITAAGSLLGIIPGAYLLKVADANHLKILLGVALLLVTLLMELNFVPEVKNKKLGRVSAGFLSGFFSATTSISGPPIALYFLSENMEKNLLRANMIWIFAIGSFCTLGSFFVAGTFQGGNLIALSLTSRMSASGRPTGLTSGSLSSASSKYLGRIISRASFRKTSLPNSASSTLRGTLPGRKPSSL